MNLKETITAFQPVGAREAADKSVLLECLEREPTVLTRENRICHFTASAWIVNPERTKILMCWHNIYRSWSWTGGHADGEENLAAVALREVSEETGLKNVRLLSDVPVSLEILTVKAHEKKGQPVSAHLHLNLTFFVEADPAEPLRVKADENSALRWMTPEETVSLCDEPEMIPVYQKLNGRLG